MHAIVSVPCMKHARCYRNYESLHLPKMNIKIEENEERNIKLQNDYSNKYVGMSFLHLQTYLLYIHTLLVNEFCSYSPIFLYQVNTVLLNTK
jgi:hypothetical protein